MLSLTFCMYLYWKEHGHNHTTKILSMVMKYFRLDRVAMLLPFENHLSSKLTLARIASSLNLLFSCNFLNIVRSSQTQVSSSGMTFVTIAWKSWTLLLSYELAFPGGPSAKTQSRTTAWSGTTTAWNEIWFKKKILLTSS